MADATAPIATDEGRSARKRRVILEAAADAFLEHGYLGTSMDEIAGRAAVSKRTVYQHFADKDRLFAEVVTLTVDQASHPVHALVRELGDRDSGSGDVEADLTDLARRQLALVMQPRIMRLRRLVIGEAGRFPALGRMFYDQGPGRTIAALAATFERLAARGLLDVDDPHLAATQFNWLVMAEPLNRAMLLGDDAPPELADLDRWAVAGVRTFLAAYAPMAR